MDHCKGFKLSVMYLDAKKVKYTFVQAVFFEDFQDIYILKLSKTKVEREHDRLLDSLAVECWQIGRAHV